jgi:outer membrane immunogenic protein
MRSSLRSNIITGGATAFAIAVAAPASALAADMPVKAPPVVAAYSWTGFYVGASGGGGWKDRNFDFTPNDAASAALFEPGLPFGLNAAPRPVSFKSSDALGGVQAGYNWQWDRNWVAGAEADFSWADIKGSGSANAVLAGLPTNVPVDEHIKWFGTVRARLGYLPTDNLMAYLTGGFAYGRAEHTGSYSHSVGALGLPVGGFGVSCVLGATCFSGSSGTTATGWTAGAGLEYAVTRNVILKAEYLYVDLGTVALTETALLHGPAFAASTFNANFHTSFNVARVGVNYRSLDEA